MGSNNKKSNIVIAIKINYRNIIIIYNVQSKIFRFLGAPIIYSQTLLSWTPYV